jgi:hypothetical protein
MHSHVTVNCDCRIYHVSQLLRLSLCVPVMCLMNTDFRAQEPNERYTYS